MAATKETEARWRAVVRDQESSGKSVADFARSRGISSSTLYWWRSALRRRSRSGCGPRLAEITLVSPGGFDGRFGEPEFELVLAGGHRLRVPSGFDPESLRRLLGVLERRC